MHIVGLALVVAAVCATATLATGIVTPRKIGATKSEEAGLARGNAELAPEDVSRR